MKTKLSLTFSATHEFGVLRFKLKPKQNYKTAFKNQLNTILFDTIWSVKVIKSGKHFETFCTLIPRHFLNCKKMTLKSGKGDIGYFSKKKSRR